MATNAEYLRRFNILSFIYDLGFKPKKIPFREGRKTVAYTYEFTPAQKGRITRLSTEVIEGVRKNSHLYNIAKNVQEGNAVFKKIKKTKNKKKKIKQLKKSGIFTTNDGIVIFSKDAEQIKIKQRGKNYKVEYIVKPKQPKGKNIKRMATKERREVFIPIPSHIWEDEDLLNIFLADLEQEYKPLHFRLAINGRQGKTLFEPSKIYHYITDSLPGNFLTDTPYVTGVYLIFKVRGRVL